MVAEITYKKKQKPKNFIIPIFRQFLKQFKNLKSNAHIIQKGPCPLSIIQQSSRNNKTFLNENNFHDGCVGIFLIFLWIL
jgi:hypothetical protein